MPAMGVVYVSFCLLGVNLRENIAIEGFVLGLLFEGNQVLGLIACYYRLHYYICVIYILFI